MEQLNLFLNPNIPHDVLPVTHYYRHINMSAHNFSTNHVDHNKT